jgi:cytochrome c-type biogenesis protein CcmH
MIYITAEAVRNSSSVLVYTNFGSRFERYQEESMRHLATLRSFAHFIAVVVALTALYTPVSAQEPAWQDIAGELMSPACPGRTLLNCTSEHAGQWQELIRQKIARGVPKDEIMQYFINIGGEEVLASPPKRGFTLAVWLLPAFALLNGAGLIILLTTRWVRRPHSREQDALPASCPDHSTQTATAVSDPYLSRVRKELQDI